MMVDGDLMITELKKAWGTIVKKKDGTKAVKKLTDDQQELLRSLYENNAPMYEVVSAMELSETRCKYELNKLKEGMV